MSAPRLIKDQPFISQSGLTERWYFVRSWRPHENGITRVAHEKFDITEYVDAIIADAKAGRL